MNAGHVENGRHLPLRRSMTDKRGVAARAERERQRIEQNGFSGSRLTGQHRQAGGEINVQALDQNNIADRQSGEHGAGRQPPVTAWTALDIQEPLFSDGDRPPDCRSA